MDVWQDVRFAVRLLLKDRWFTLVATAALALGIGANTAVFTFVNAVLIRGLPFDEPDRIIAMASVDDRGRQLGVSRLDFEDWQQAARSYSGLALFLFAPMNVSEESLAPEQFAGAYGTANMFKLIGQQPVLGRDFRPEDDRPEGDPVVLISHATWTNRYGSDPNILGRVVRINSLPSTIIGVMPRDMRFPLNTDVWMPISMLPPAARNPTRGVRNFSVFGRLADGVTLAQARAELEIVGMQLAREHAATNKDIKPTVMLFNERATGPQIRLIFLSLMGAVVFVLLIACANVANLLLARAAARSREIAIRVSLGASRWRIVRQLLIESILLSALAGLLGLGLAVTGIRLFDLATVDAGKPYWMTFSLDPLVYFFLASVCVATGVIFGLAPALHVSKTDVNDVLKEAGGRSGTGGMRARRWTGALIVVEITLTLVLLAGAAFMMRSFLAYYQADLGFDTRPLLTMRMFLPLTKYPDTEPRAALVQQIEDRLQGVGALQSAALTTNPPTMGGFVRRLAVDGRAVDDPSRLPEVTMVGVTDRYFETLGVKPLRGRTFTANDGLAGYEAAIVNQRFVSMHFQSEDPVGRRITLTDATPSAQQSGPKSATIVGVVPTVRQRNFQDPDPDPVVYLPYRADPQRNLTMIVRVPGGAGPIAPVVREEMRAIEPDLPLVNIQTMDQMLALQRWPFRVFGSMFAIFAGIALVLAAVGLYAVTAYSVTQRTAEIGVRMALGAQPVQVMWLVLRRTVMQLAIGLPLGLAGALGVGRLLQSFLVQTSSRDPATIGSIGAVMVFVAIAACIWPARRATRLDPVSALRYE
jgi:predicted permease